MKTHILTAIRLSAICLLLFAGAYSMLVWGFASIVNGKRSIVNSASIHPIGQAFTQDKYFQGRPLAVSYNGGGSGGSNKGPSNPECLAQVQARIDTFLVHNSTVKKSEIPSDLVTASGSGLDPHISPQGAQVQMARIAKIRSLELGQVQALVDNCTEKPLLGLFGTAKINVLLLNKALDEISK